MHIMEKETFRDLNQSYPRVLIFIRNQLHRKGINVLIKQYT